MNDKIINKIIDTIIYLLVIILICLIFYNLFLLFTQNNPSAQAPRNSIEASPPTIQEA
ncbi:hypothetical protein [Clostridium sp. SM-530-WT-3G]|uniref:hypothetical protein n=1 Tax=Clostridium sp. SM-530-WT-3G TaxID=2725303 RepID=UPI00145EDEAC|nr:hypothetical protein [Clostridium sp. SM-530-WT-3G]NME83514.1 hypothetical protein [Clostridium sp. SM-530-WT-3G]